MPPTYKPSEITTYIENLLITNATSLGLQAVHYGDQRIIAAVPAVCIEPAKTKREVAGIPYQTDNTIELTLIVYHTSLQGVELVQKAADEVTEAIEDLINADALGDVYGGTLLGGQVHHAHFTSTEYGYRVLADEMMRANRMVLTCRSKTKLVNP